MSDEKNVWNATDPLGRKVKLSAKRMKHVRDGHPEMTGAESAMKSTVEDPNVIYTSNSVPTCDVYFKMGAHSDYPSLYVKVVVQHEVEPGQVLTSHLDDELGGIDPGGMKYVNRDN